MHLRRARKRRVPATASAADYVASGMISCRSVELCRRYGVANNARARASYHYDANARWRLVVPHEQYCYYYE